MTATTPAAPQAAAPTDRELLEWAAKLAGRGYTLGKDWHDQGQIYVDGRSWNPLTDDGDAFRLAVKLEIVSEYRRQSDSAHAYYAPLSMTYAVKRASMDSDSTCAAMRRAIVSIAAHIGRKAA